MLNFFGIKMEKRKPKAKSVLIFHLSLFLLFAKSFLCVRKLNMIEIWLSFCTCSRGLCLPRSQPVCRAADRAQVASEDRGNQTAGDRSVQSYVREPGSSRSCDAGVWRMWDPVDSTEAQYCRSKSNKCEIFYYKDENWNWNCYKEMSLHWIEPATNR